MTQLGLGSYGVAWAIGVSGSGYEAPANPLDAFGLLRLTHELGLHVVQIADNLPLHTLSNAERAALRAEAAQHDIMIEVGTRGIHPDHLQMYLAIARDFASPILRVVVDTADHHPAPEEVVALLRPHLPEFAASGITLALENHDRFKAQTLVDIITTLDHPNVGVCLDTVNSFGSLEGPEVVIPTLAPFVVNLHIKEFIIRRLDHNMGFTITGVPAGQGMLDIPRLLKQLQSSGRSFNAIIETWLSPSETMAATIAQEADWVQQSVAYLRQWIAD